MIPMHLAICSMLFFRISCSDQMEMKKILLVLLHNISTGASQVGHFIRQSLYHIIFTS